MARNAETIFFIKTPSFQYAAQKLPSGAPQWQAFQRPALKGFFVHYFIVNSCLYYTNGARRSKHPCGAA
jgi:hypothetical protein